MTIIQTDEWLKKYADQPVKMCNQLTKYFPYATSKQIYDHLVMHGMYQHPIKKELIDSFCNQNYWQVIKKEEQRLKDMWEGPDIPIFIFPSNPNASELREKFNGKSGLAFRNKLFLFISDKNTDDEIRALLIHEYNHVCRLEKYSKKEEAYTLLDSMILEGLAEYAVAEQLGESLTANWTSYYSEQELEKMWKKIYPLRNLLKDHWRHDQLLYGTRRFPELAGYCVGYFLVNQYTKKNQLPSRKLITLSSEELAGLRKNKTDG